MGIDKNPLYYLAILVFVLGIIVVPLSYISAHTWTTVHTGTFLKVEFVATRNGNTMIYFEDGTIEAIEGIWSVRFKKGDKITIELNGHGIKRFHKLENENR